MGWSYFWHLVTFTVGDFFYSLIKKLESAGTCSFQAKFRQIALFDALLTFFAIVASSVGVNLSLIHHGEHSFSQSVCGGHYVFTHEDNVFLRRTIHFRSCAQDMDKMLLLSLTFF